MSSAPSTQAKDRHRPVGDEIHGSPPTSRSSCRVTNPPETAEWTVVSRRSGGRRRRGNHRAPELPAAAAAAATGAVSAPDYTSDDILKDRERISARFRDSACYRQLKQCITRILDSQSESVASITHAICLGTGSFVPSIVRFETMRTTHIQLDAFLAMVEILAERNGAPITCVFQEPAYVPADVAFLQGLGHTVVQSPRGFDMVQPQSFVYGIHLYRDVGMKDDWKASSERLEEMDKTFNKLAFPCDDDGLHAFNDTSLYWRKQCEAGEVTATPA
ncbi:uncharacterized protein E0L32_001200 [Thyridium curvatum]|uniref:SRR1-like domain-containing protein n=1 Tax=Thyridium curvatum TaxID=1093900 RepID=A0A507ANA2_9PEZI|nr:uncharacterized protein E0L32_001200 [Thyridium curvatum]TPX11382.1 hypothetical protein E0L32_001200 [Thyridium curvatum]